MAALIPYLYLICGGCTMWLADRAHNKPHKHPHAINVIEALGTITLIYAVTLL